MPRTSSAMHIVTTTQALFMGPSLGELPPGRWLCSDANSFELAMIAPRGTVELDHYAQLQGLDKPKKILVVRSGAIGDLLFLTPVLKALDAKYDCAIYLSCFPKHHDIMRDAPAYMMPYPLPAHLLPEYDIVINLENVIELAGTKHATDALAEACGVTVTDYTPAYEVTATERHWAQTTLPKQVNNDTNTWVPRVALQLRASVKNRDYPLNQWNEVISGLVARGWEVLLYGSKGQIPALPKGTPPQVIDCSSMSFREAAAVLETCDVFCGVDSAFVNLCPALGVPAIGLYGPFPWEARTSHAPKTTALSGVGDCAGCSWCPSGGRHFPPGMECAKTQVCSVLASIDPKRIVTKIGLMAPAQLV